MENDQGISGIFDVFIAESNLSEIASSQTGNERKSKIRPQELSLPDFSLPGIKTAIQNSICYSINNLNESGEFLYKYDLIKQRKINKYNILRHTGTLYSIYEVLSVALNTGIWNEAGAALHYLHRQVRYCQALPEIPVVFDSNEQVKLGANALAIIMLLKKNQVEPNDSEIGLIYELTKFVMFMQQPSGQFYSKINPEDGAVMPFDSGYYPGQAALALIRLYKTDGDHQWLQAARKGVDYLINTRVYDRASEKFIHDQWLMIALAELYETTGEERYLGKCRTIAGLVIASFSNEAVLSNICGLATRIEGLNSLAMLEKQIDLTNYYKIVAAISLVVPVLLNAQVKTNTATGGIDVSGGFVKSKAKQVIRIDYVQHATSALLGYGKLVSDL
jgi:hypothetical protein